MAAARSRHLSSSATRRQQLAARAHGMRVTPTASEARLWAELRGSRLSVPFRRQVPIGPYIVDFLAPRLRLVVEVDGGYHAQRAAADARRERYLQRAGYRVVRVSAELVMSRVDEAVRLIRAELTARAVIVVAVCCQTSL